MENNQLQHHGVVGMKWGVRRTPAQLGHAPSRSKKRKGKNGKSDSKLKFFKRKNQTQKAKEEVESVEAKKERILKSRSPKELYKNADLFTTQELQSAYNRLNLERSIASLSPKEVSKGEQIADGAVKWGKKINEVSDTGIKMYNNIAKLHNTFSEDGKKNPWPLIKDDDKVKKFKKEAKKATEGASKTFAKAAKKTAEKEDDTVYEGEVVGGSKKEKTKSSSKKSGKSTIIDADWEEVTVSDVKNTTSYSLGQDYVAGLLEERH